MRFIHVYVILASFSSVTVAQTHRLVSAEDCVTIKRIKQEPPNLPALLVNRHKTRLAYLVTVPNLRRNENELQLRIRSLPIKHDEQPRIITAPGLFEPQWRPDGKHLVALARRGGRVAVISIDADQGTSTEVFLANVDIQEFAMDDSGNRLIYVTEEPSATVDISPTPEENASGYRVRSPLDKTPESETSTMHRRKVWLVERSRSGWDKPQLLRFRLPYRNDSVDSLSYLQQLHISFSPNGRYFTATYADAPDQLRRNPIIRTRLHQFPYLLLTLVYDLDRHQTTMPFPSPWSSSLPLWSKDSRGFIVTAESPIDSPWQQQDQAASATFLAAMHLFYVSVDSKRVEEIAHHVSDVFEQPLNWQSSDEVLIHNQTNSVAIYRRSNGEWHSTNVWSIPIKSGYSYMPLASDGKSVFAAFENTTQPPELVSNPLGTLDIEPVDVLNPEFDNLTLARVGSVNWHTSTGTQIEGTILFPPGHTPNKRYPLVIQTKYETGQFLCDAGDNYPSFAPQPMAANGMLYLIRHWPQGRSSNDDQKGFPTGYPGGLAEAAFQEDIWESAIRELDRLGLIDPARVGIIGFSRSGWYTEFLLTHTQLSIRAATVTDNVEFSFSEYGASPWEGARTSSDSMYGGPPSGPTLENWLQHSVSFNLDKIHTPLLLEQMGAGTPYRDLVLPPLYLSRAIQIANIVNHFGGAAELYYYPNEIHQPEHPRARLATLERNIDWYRFWLENFERQHPEDPQQFERWRSIRSRLDGYAKR